MRQAIRKGTDSCVPSVPIVPRRYFPGFAGTRGTQNAKWGRKMFDDETVSAADLLENCRARGILVDAIGGNLEIDAPTGILTEEVLQGLKKRKPEILALLHAGREIVPSFLPPPPPPGPPVVPESIRAIPIPACSGCGRRAVVAGQPGRPAGLCWACWLQQSTTIPDEPKP